MKNKTKKWIKGSITVLMIIIMLPMMTMSAIIVDASRINMARSMVSSAGDLAMNSALANYDTILKDVYGLFAMSQDENMTPEKLSDTLKQYFEKTLTSYGVVNEAEAGNYVDSLIGDFKDIIYGVDGKEMGNFLKMEIGEDFSIEKVANSSLANPDILRSQIVEYMKYRAPINFGLSFLDSINAFKTVSDQTDVVEKQVDAQQSTQDVTKACKDSIDAIRAFDKTVDKMHNKSDSSSVTGKNNVSDGDLVKIQEYSKHVEKYYELWGSDNYKLINKINLNFNVAPVSLSGYYLVDKDVNSSDWFIANSNTSVSYDNSGISVTVDSPADLAAAKSAFDTTRGTLNTNASYTAVPNSYASAMLSPSNINSNGFNNLDNAITGFKKFESFLKDSGNLKYSSVKNVLEKIYTLGKQYENYIGKLDEEIGNQQQIANTANQNKINAANAESTAVSTMQAKYGNINTTNSNAKSLNIDFLLSVASQQGEDLYQVVKSMTEQTFTAPSSVSSFSESQFKYLKVYKDIINSRLKTSRDYKDVATAASNYLTASNPGSFSSYMTKKVGSDVTSNDLYKVLDYLNTNNNNVKAIKNAVTKANSESGKYDQYEREEAAANQQIQNRETEKSTATTNFHTTLGTYANFTVHYQNDLMNYQKYQESAQAAVSAKAKNVKDQFTEILSNLKTLVTSLEDIESKLETTKTAIEAYNKKLDSWNTANNTYVSKNKNDNFSKQNTSDINASKTQYDLVSLKALQDYVTLEKEEINSVYEYLDNKDNYKYGDKHLKDLGSWDQVRDAARTNSEVTTSVVPGFQASVADTLFPKLCKVSTSAPTITYGVEQQSHLQFIKDGMVPIKFLSYLNENYPESTGNQQTSSSTSQQSASDSPEDSYNSTKSNLEKGGGVEDGSEDNKVGKDGKDKYGYTYKNKSISKDNLPSKGEDPKDVKNNKFALKKDGDKVDASSGMSEQKSVLSTILSGIGNIAGMELENIYILNYIFENFSYNTLVQDIVMESKGDRNGGNFGNLASAKSAISTTDVTGAPFKKSFKMLNGYYNKNDKNNYLYGAEIEYMLYGDSSPAGNVTKAKASIYAIRFAFNCIYAFTNSSIRNSTRIAGMAVQAATMGFVPYQLVMIVLQLALAAAESAIDLDMMNSGLKVAVVKTDKTWSLSIKGAINSAKEIATAAATTAATAAIKGVSSGLQNLVDSTADNIHNSLADLETSMGESVKNKAQEIMDSAFAGVQSKIDEVLNEIQFSDEYKTKEEAISFVNSKFDSLSSSITSEITSNFGGNEIGNIVVPLINEKVTGVVNDTKSSIINELNNMLPDKTVGEVIAGKMGEIKTSVSEAIGRQIDNITGSLDGKLSGIIDEFSGSIQGYISETEGKLTEQATETIKEKVGNITDNYIGKYLGGGSSLGGVETPDGKLDSSVSSVISFGYKDYLMLFVFIQLNINGGKNVIKRVADVIQMNVQNASSDDYYCFKHKVGSNFLMKNACTYVNVNNISVKLDMLFMNMDFFTNSLKDDNTEVDGQFTPAATIKYKGLYGY